MNGAIKFSAQDILPFIARARLGETVCVVGGQALNLWSEVFAAELGKHRSLEPLTSKDLDFLGSSADARKLAQKFGGALSLPGFDDQTPSTGLVVLEIGGKTLEIDFLETLLGVAGADVLKRSLVLNFPIVTDAGPTSVPVRIMHPIHCLQSRATNLVHPATRRSSDTAKAPLTILKFARRYKTLDERYRTITLANTIARIEKRRAVLSRAQDRRRKEP